ncbi:MAG TPA: hypothetical protein VNA27_02815 [Rubrobacteraceae bacterium]|nr:hypothetical protein [Rubrobacteraceae bacterium]
MQSTAPINTLRRVPLFKGFTDDPQRVAKQGLEQIVREFETNGLEREPARSMREVLR